MPLIVKGTEFNTDKEGYLKDLSDWSEPIAEAIASEEGITLGEGHWEIIHLLREFYHTYQISPAMRPLVKTIKNNLGDEKGRSIYLMKLFPGSQAKVASKIAGLPKPTNCI